MRFIELNGFRSFWHFTLARWACIPFSLLGAYICFRWARELYGGAAGLLALTLWCFSPNIITHGQLITPDLGATALGVTAAYFFWRWLKRPEWPRTLAAGLALGIAELAKTTWIVLFGLWPLLWLIWWFSKRRDLPTRRWFRELGQMATILTVALYLVNLGYAFEGSFEKLGDYRFASESLGGPPEELDGAGEGGNRFTGTWLDELPVPLPESYVMGIDLQRLDFEGKMWSYLRGEWRLGGWWYYYLYALVIKVPLGTWILILLALIVGVFLPGYSATWRDELTLLGPIAVVLALVSSQTGFNHHMRYVLPVFPFAFVWASKVAGAVHLRHWIIALIVAAALFWSVASSLCCYPHSLSYFNELVGGPTGGHAHLAHSNIDWGHNLLYLKRWLEKHPDACPLRLAFNGQYYPRIAGIEYTAPPLGPDYVWGARGDPNQVGPLPGWYALSIDKICARSKKHAYFFCFEPVAMPGYSIHVYHITADEANRVRRELGLPELPSPDPRSVRNKR